MGIKHKYFQSLIVSVLLLSSTVLISSCGGSGSNRRSYSEEKLDEMRDSIDAWKQMIGTGRVSQAEVDRLRSLENRVDYLLGYLEDDKFDDDDAARYKEAKADRDRLHAQTEQAVLTRPVSVASFNGVVGDSVKYIPIYLEHGECLYYDVQAEDRVDVWIFNGDTRKLVDSKRNVSTAQDSLPIRFSGIYLVGIEPKGRQNVAAEVGFRPSGMARLVNPKKIAATVENCKKGDFMAREIKGVKMKTVFEEPRKFTLRGGIKSFFSGAKRALVAVQVEPGATDVLYNLRISTNETPPKDEKDFYKGMAASYKKIRVLGLPIYESESGSGLLTTLLGLNTPVREEDAYINLYVFYNAAEARKFQNGGDVTKLKYALDYSTLGTQSCNGRIPCKGQKTVYFGFENERMRYNNYVWLSALLSVPQTEYVRPQYSLEQP